MKQSVKYLKILANLLVAVLVIAAIYFLVPKVVIFFMPFVIGYIISLIANPLVRFLEKRLKMVRKHGSMVIIIGVLAAVILIFYFAVAKIVEETIQLITNLPQIYNNLVAEFAAVGNNLQIFLNRLPSDMQQTIAEVTTDFTAYVSDLVQAVSVPTFTAAGNFARNVPGTLIAIIMCILSAYFFTAERDRIMGWLREHMPKGILERVLYVIKDLKHVVGGYFKAQLKIMVVVYVILVVGLLILKVSYVPLVAFIIAFLDMLPFFGTGTVLGPWAIIKLLSGDYKMAIALIVLYAITQVVRQVIQPKIVGDSIGMNPLATLIFMYIGYKLGGVLGMIIAVPVGMIIINLYKAGIFDTQIRCVKELIHDFNEFRKL